MLLVNKELLYRLKAYCVASSVSALIGSAGFSAPEVIKSSLSIKTFLVIYGINFAAHFAFCVFLLEIFIDFSRKVLLSPCSPFFQKQLKSDWFVATVGDLSFELRDMEKVRHICYSVSLAIRFRQLFGVWELIKTGVRAQLPF